MHPKSRCTSCRVTETLVAWAKLAFLPLPPPWLMLCSPPPESEFADCRSIRPLFLRPRDPPHETRASRLPLHRFLYFIDGCHFSPVCYRPPKRLSASIQRPGCRHFPKIVFSLP